MSIGFYTDAAYFQVAGSRTYQATVQPDKVAMILNLGRDDLYIVTDVPRLQCELEVSRFGLQFVCF